MLAHIEHRYHLQTRLEWIIQSALLVYVVCAVISISAMQAAYILALVAWAGWLTLAGDTQSLRWPLLGPYGAFVLASVLATLLGVAPFKSLVELRNVGEILVFYLVVNVVTTEAHATRLTRVLIAAGMAMGLYGLSQSLVHGVDFRAHGTMSIYMTFAGLLMLVDLMAMAQALYHRQRWQLAWTLPAIVVLTAALLVTHTRGAWLGLIAGCSVLLGCQKRLLLLALPLAVLIILLLAPQSIRARALSIVDRHEITAQERLSMWMSGLHIIRDYPWTGIGMGAMVQVYARYREPASPVAPTRRIGHVHNNGIQVAAERGLLGLAAWLWFWVAYCWHTWRLYTRLAPEHTAAKALVVGSLASVVAFHIEGLFEHTFGDSEVITLTYFLMALPFVVHRVHCDARTYGTA
jgi:putative inorganic carbon (HCO3(-)) transporter